MISDMITYFYINIDFFYIMYNDSWILINDNDIVRELTFYQCPISKCKVRIQLDFCSGQKLQNFK
jgi:hypothetical protein